MTTETKKTNEEIKQGWLALWQFVSKEISWCDGTIDFDSFFEFGSQQFDIAIKGKGS